MTLDNLFLELKTKPDQDYIVSLKYKYDFETDYCTQNEVLSVECNGTYFDWLNDWNEGQTDVEVTGYIAVNDVDTREVKE